MVYFPGCSFVSADVVARYAFKVVPGSASLFAVMIAVLILGIAGVGAPFLPQVFL